MNAKVYQIIDWSRHFENDRSRQVDTCSFVCVPNKQDGMGLTYIMSLPDGHLIHSVWDFILGACSKQKKPREGWLTDNGRQDGRPWRVSVMAARWWTTTEKMQSVLDVLASPDVAWMRTEIATNGQVTPDSRPTPAVTTLNGIEGNGIEGKKDPLNPPQAGEANAIDSDLAESAGQNAAEIAAAKSSNDETLEGFQRFWEAWPASRRKVNPAGCRRAWKRQKLEPIAETVIQSLPGFKASKDWIKGFVPNPLTWLNQRRWEASPDEPGTGKNIKAEKFNKIAMAVGESLS